MSNVNQVRDTMCVTVMKRIDCSPSRMRGEIPDPNLYRSGQYLKMREILAENFDKVWEIHPSSEGVLVAGSESSEGS